MCDKWNDTYMVNCINNPNSCAFPNPQPGTSGGRWPISIRCVLERRQGFALVRWLSHCQRYCADGSVSTIIIIVQPDIVYLSDLCHRHILCLRHNIHNYYTCEAIV